MNHNKTLRKSGYICKELKNGEVNTSKQISYKHVKRNAVRWINRNLENTEANHEKYIEIGEYNKVDKEEYMRPYF